MISAISGNLPTDSEVCLPVSCIIFSVGGFFDIKTENGKTNAGNCFYVKADINFKATPINSKGFVIIFFDAVSPEHYFLSSNYEESIVVKLEWEGNEELLHRTYSNMSNEDSDIFLDEIFKKLFNLERKTILHKYDDRVVLIDEHIRKNIREKISNKDLAAKIHLSESRFYHFFKEQTHVNVSRYILWLRLKTIFKRYLTSESKLNTFLYLTNFTDLSHFIKSFKSFFGESPKRLLNK